MRRMIDGQSTGKYSSLKEILVDVNVSESVDRSS